MSINRSINKIMAIIMVTITILQTLFTVFVLEDKVKILTTVVPMLVILTAIVLFLHLKKLLVDQLKYIIVLATVSINFAFVFVFHDLNGIITVYLVLALIALYQDYKLIIMAAVLLSCSLTYGFLSEGAESMFGLFNNTTGFVNVLFSLSLVVLIFVMNTRFYGILRKDREKERQENLQSAEQIKRILSQISETSGVLLDIESQVNKEILEISEINKGVSDQFMSIEDKTMEQSNAMDAMKQNVAAQIDEIDQITMDNKVVHDFTAETYQVTNNVEQDVKTLNEDVKEVRIQTEAAVVSLEVFKTHTKKVNDVLSVINGITHQINLLALNASIEAARAGEQGKGFAVVAQEVGKLAVESEKSTAQITGILSDIQKQSDELSSKIGIINTNMEGSVETTTKVATTFTSLKDDAHNATDNAKAAFDKATDVKTSSDNLTESVERMLSSTNESTELVKSGIADIENQALSVSKIVEGSKQLHLVVKELDSLLNNTL